MALMGYLTCDVNGITQSKRTPVFAFTHHAEATGPSQPFVIRKQLDAATPRFREKLRDPEFRFSTWKLELYHNPPTGGVDVHYLTIKLTGARLVWIRAVMPDPYLEPAMANVHEYEELAFQYDDLQIDPN